MNNEKLEAEWRKEATQGWLHRIGMIGLYDHIHMDCYLGGFITGKKSSQAEIDNQLEFIKDRNKVIAQFKGMYDKSNEIIKNKNQEIQKLTLQLERAEEVLEEISTSTVEVGFYVELTWEAGLAMDYFKNKDKV